MKASSRTLPRFTTFLHLGGVKSNILKIMNYYFRQFRVQRYYFFLTYAKKRAKKRPHCGRFFFARCEEFENWKSQNVISSDEFLRSQIVTMNEDGDNSRSQNATIDMRGRHLNFQSAFCFHCCCVFDALKNATRCANKILILIGNGLILGKK